MKTIYTLTPLTAIMSKGLIDPTYNIHKTKLNYPKHAGYEDIETEVSFMK